VVISLTGSVPVRLPIRTTVRFLPEASSKQPRRKAGFSTKKLASSGALIVLLPTPGTPNCPAYHNSQFHTPNLASKKIVLIVISDPY
jgi:hypothetical protein